MTRGPHFRFSILVHRIIQFANRASFLWSYAAQPIKPIFLPKP